MVAGQPLPELGRQPVARLRIGGRSRDGSCDAPGDAAAAVGRLSQPVVPVLLGATQGLIPLLAQPGPQRDGAADAEKEAAEMGFSLAGAVEVAGLQGREASAWNARAIVMPSSISPDRIASSASSGSGEAASAVSVLMSASAIPR
jgi:hypothetical protein